MPLIIAHGSAFIPGTGTVFGGGLEVSLTLDTRGATVIYIFGSAVFNINESGSFDSEGNTYTLIADTFSTCNGGISGLRVFNPKTSATHRFSITGQSPYNGTELIVVAFAPTVTGPPYVNNRAISVCNPVHAGSITTPFNDAVFVAAAGAGCGWDNTPQIDSDFTMIDTLTHLAVAYKVVPLISTLVDPIWTTLLTTPGQLDPRGEAILEGFGIFTGDRPFSKGNTRIYEA